MGEQYVDLFAAGAYALNAKLLAALSQPSMSWFFYVVAAAGIVVSIVQGGVESNSRLWLHHLGVVAVASVLIFYPYRVDLSSLTYAAPGQLEKVFNTHTGAAPHLTYLIERFGSAVATRARGLLYAQPVLTVPSVASQVYELTADPGTLNDPQLKANLQSWRERLAPHLLKRNPQLANELRESGLVGTFLNPAPSDASWVGPDISKRAVAVRGLLSSDGSDLVAIVADEATLLSKIAQNAGAEPWAVVDNSVRIRMASRGPATINEPPPMGTSSGYYDAVMRGATLAHSMIEQLPSANDPVDVNRTDQLYDLLGRSILFTAGARYTAQNAQLATLGSYCQRLGDGACRVAQGRLIQSSGELRVPEADRYNTPSFTTWLKQPLASILLTVAALLLSALSSLIVAVLPFLLGVAKAIAILMSTIGLWMMLWPGRLRDAISWMVLPVSFVALWGFLFNLWSDAETFLTAIASVVTHSDYGSFSAGRIMSIAISIGYLGLPVIALSIVSGGALRSLGHASARLETALLIAWRARRTMTSFGRRWLTSSPLARRWNQRLYRTVGLGSLRNSRPPTSRARKFSTSAVPGAKSTAHTHKAPNLKQRSGKKGSSPPDDFSPV